MQGYSVKWERTGGDPGDTGIPYNIISNMTPGTTEDAAKRVLPFSKAIYPCQVTQTQLCYHSGRRVNITNWEGDGVSPALDDLIAQGGCVTFDVMVGRNSTLREDGAVGPAFASPATGSQVRSEWKEQ
ncbi:hypothetical protein HYFRA_00009506 [Hymenoscyphus fraxineus]|uniref:Uncharacterized protein n=1 Tax=Hymenoscyphus fraxineus TaxID=746836 RepID=A0A9N9PVF9_9HELO|nr:hypothetical protein HYFRA_00009506 [Hymenoscyphus fraxineus]